MTEENEFDNISVDESAPENTFSDVPEQQSSMVGDDKAEVFDWTKAPDTVNVPRVDLDGKTVTLESAEIILPRKTDPWQNPFKGTTKYKGCQLRIKFDVENQTENYSGIKVFPREGGDENLCSYPALKGDPREQTHKFKSQAAKLMSTYAEFKNKDVATVSLKEFMAFLNSKPKAIMKKESVDNPKTGETVEKNFIAKFVSE